MTTESQQKANKKWKQKAYKQGKIKVIRLELFSGAQGDIIAFLKTCKNQRKFIIDAVRESMIKYKSDKKKDDLIE